MMVQKSVLILQVSRSVIYIYSRQDTLAFIAGLSQNITGDLRTDGSTPIPAPDQQIMGIVGNGCFGDER